MIGGHILVGVIDTLVDDATDGVVILTVQTGVGRRIGGTVLVACTAGLVLRQSTVGLAVPCVPLQFKSLL